MNLKSQEQGMRWILLDLANWGPRKADPWWPRHLRALRECGFVRPALRLHKGWEITDKGRVALYAQELT